MNTPKLITSRRSRPHARLPSTIRQNSGSKSHNTESVASIKLTRQHSGRHEILVTAETVSFSVETIIMTKLQGGAVVCCGDSLITQAFRSRLRMHSSPHQNINIQGRRHVPLHLQPNTWPFECSGHAVVTLEALALVIVGRN